MDEFDVLDRPADPELYNLKFLGTIDNGFEDGETYDLYEQEDCEAWIEEDKHETT